MGSKIKITSNNPKSRQDNYKEEKGISLGKAKEIATGFTNWAFGKNKTLKEERLEICRNCELCTVDWFCNSKKTIIHQQTGERVKGCGCSLPAKASNPESNCPAGKW